MQDVGRDFIFRHSWVHDFVQLFHRKFLVFVDVHEALLEEDFLIEEPFLTGHLLEACRDALIAINNQDH